MNLDEQLSRLIDGDLPEEEAAPLRARIRNEPEVARVYGEMKALVASLSALPETAPAPPLRVVPLRSSRSTVALAAPWVLAAAATVAWLVGSRDPEVSITSGETRIEGDLSVAAGAVTVDLDGNATIGVEPMTKQMLAGLAGAAVTVAVYEGTAIVRAAGEDPVTIEAGDSHRFGGDGGDSADVPTDRAALQQRLADLEKQLAATREALQLEQFSGALARGQLAAEQGVPTAWPPDVPASMTSDRFAAELGAHLEGMTNVEVEHVDCAEYPCIAALRYVGADQSLTWGDDVAERVKTWITGAYGQDHSLSLNKSMFVEDDREARYIVFGAHGETDDPNLRDRQNWRISTLVEQLGEEVRAGAPPPGTP